MTKHTQYYNSALDVPYLSACFLQVLFSLFDLPFIIELSAKPDNLQNFGLKLERYTAM